MKLKSKKNKMMKKIILLAILLVISAHISQEVLDKIVAVVDNEFILKSELEFQTQSRCTA